ncbi:unnamed protein product [Blepharisma stoltei]|uniref:Uncharacterized protein n=1 Tax=Blepharisma stoltei TaxID=1481888 RepID=A0AAU9KCJ4_9CILI|nr:unnamed protein product [Blepharisma stoltei]
MEFNCVWFLNQLWKESSLFNAKIPLADTLLFDSESPTNYKWLFTDRKGYIKKKHSENVKLDKIFLAFLNHTMTSSGSDNEIMNPEDPGVIYIRDNTFKLLDKKMSFAQLMAQSLLNNEAMQAFTAGPEHIYSRYIVNFKKSEGKYIYNCSKEYIKREIQEKTKVYAQNYIDKLTEITETALRVIEKNSRRCIEELQLIFFEDLNNNLWLMGSRICKTANFLVPKSIFPIKRAQSQGRLQENSVTRSSFMDTTQSWNKRSGTASIGQKPNTHKKCPGDFCNFIVTSQTLSSKQEIDYDDLLQKVRNTYFSGKEKDIEKVKYTLRVDNLMEQKSRNKDKIIRKLIPYKLILLGKKIIIDKKKDLVEVDIGQFINCVNNSLDNEQENLHECAMKTPFHYYDSVRVCDRCYEVYTLFDCNKKKTPDFEPKIPLVNITNPFPLSFLSKKNSITSSKLNSPRRSVLYLSSSQKDNINDLLNDMDNTLFEIKYGEKTAKLKRADDISRTISRQRAQSQSQELRKKAPLETVKAEMFDHDILTSQLFPDAKYFLKVKVRSNKHSQYLQKLKEMNFSRGKLHHFRDKVTKK